MGRQGEGDDSYFYHTKENKILQIRFKGYFMLNLDKENTNFAIIHKAPLTLSF